MAHLMTQRDGYALMTLLVHEALGENSTISKVDASNFVSAGEELMASGSENVINSLSLVLGRTFMAVRPYNAKFNIINAISTGAYAHRIRKISFYTRDPKPAGDWNTDLFTNLADGFTNGQNVADGDAQSTKSMWEQNKPVALEMNFSGSIVWEDSTTVYEDQLKQAFNSVDSFNSFVSGIMTEKANDIESQKEAFARMTFLNRIGMCYDLTASGTTAVNLTYEFNQKFGTNYTSAQLRSTYLTEFTKFMVSKIKTDSDMMENRSVKHHWFPAKVGHVLTRHTPKDRQRLVLYTPLINDVQSYVFPSVFNDQYLKIENYEGILFWQNEAVPAAVDVVPAIPDTTGLTGVQTAGDRVQLDYVVGALFDEDALMVDFQLERSNSTPLEARKNYRNIWWSFSKNAINDPTENFILYYMADPVTPGE